MCLGRMADRVPAYRSCQCTATKNALARFSMLEDASSAVAISVWCIRSTVGDGVETEPLRQQRPCVRRTQNSGGELTVRRGEETWKRIHAEWQPRSIASHFPSPRFHDGDACVGRRLERHLNDPTTQSLSSLPPRRRRSCSRAKQRSLLLCSRRPLLSGDTSSASPTRRDFACAGVSA